MQKISDIEFNNLERDSKGNIVDLFYWYLFISEKQKKMLSDTDKQELSNIKSTPGYVGKHFAMSIS